MFGTPAWVFSKQYMSPWLFYGLTYRWHHAVRSVNGSEAGWLMTARSSGHTPPRPPLFPRPDLIRVTNPLDVNAPPDYHALSPVPAGISLGQLMVSNSHCHWLAVWSLVYHWSCGTMQFLMFLITLLLRL